MAMPKKDPHEVARGLLGIMPVPQEDKSAPPGARQPGDMPLEDHAAALKEMHGHMQAGDYEKAAEAHHRIMSHGGHAKE
jgi:hypothetical protein